MEKTFEPINEENYIFEFELFGMKLVFGKRAKNEDTKIIDQKILKNIPNELDIIQYKIINRKVRV